jgi:hypothetical protein
MLFETNPVNLSDLVTEARTGEIQLPDFQRPWKWDDERIMSLLATVALGYPLGVMMTLETGGSELQFKARPIEGADIPDGATPAELLMDGQQRLTSLLQALASEDPVDTKDARGKKLLRWYYVDIERVLGPNADMKDAIVSVPADRKVLDASGKRVILDLGTREAEFAAGMFPLQVVYDSQARGRWRRGYENSADSHPDIWERFEATVLKNIDIYQIPVIRLNKATPKEAVCTVFEYVNTKGVQLTTFELLTATYAANREYSAEHGEDFHLPAEWAALKDRLTRHNAVSEIDDTDFLRAVCLVSTHFRRRGRPGTDAFTQPAASCKRSDILDLELSEYRRWAPDIESALEWGARFLDRQGIFVAYDVPYRTQISSLAAIRTVLGAETDSPEAEDKIARWYWCGVLGEQYSGSLDSRLPRDLEQVAEWVRGGREPASVTEASFNAARLDTMTTRNSAAYKGVYALVLKQGCYDWIFYSDPIDAAFCADQEADVGLIFPKEWCVKNHIEASRRDSIVNKTILASRTRRIMGNSAPSDYLARLQTEVGLPTNWIDDIVSTHLIEPAHLHANDFDKFYLARSAALLALIEEAMGKRAISPEAAPETIEDYEPEQPE